jgi:uncharacterized protein YkwD
MSKVRRILMLLLLFGILWHFYGDTFKQSGVRGAFEEIKGDAENIIENPKVTATLDTLKQEIQLLWNQFTQDEQSNTPQPEPSKPNLDQPTSQSFSIYNIEIGEQRADVENQLGEPKRSTLNEYGVQWHTYHENYYNFIMVAYDEQDQVAGLYTNNDLLTSTLGITFANTKEEVLAKLDKPLKAIRKGLVLYQLQDNGENNTFLIDNNYVTIFYDKHEDNTVTAIQIIRAELEQQKKAYFAEPSEALKEGLEYQLFDLTNAARVNHGLSALSWEDPLRKTARDHSEDMAVNNYFSHQNLEGQSPFDRMTEDAIAYRGAGENLATGQPSSIFAHEGLMNSLGHRENILKTEFEFLAVGVAFNQDAQPFYTENFLIK